MHPQLSACSFVAPLKQYPKTTLCRRPKRCLQTAPRSSESPHSFSRCRRHEAPSPPERHRRQFHTAHRPLTDHGLSNIHASSAKIGLQQASQSFSINQRRGTHSGPEPEGIQRYAVIGGGISGLTSAFKLAASKPETKVTLYESSDRLGGCVQTKYVNVDNGHIVFEQGPRTLQPHTLSGLFTLDLVEQSCLCLFKILTFITDQHSRHPRQNHVYAQKHAPSSKPLHILPRPPREDARRRPRYF